MTTNLLISLKMLTAATMNQKWCLTMQKYRNIKLKGLNSRWSAIDEYSDGETDYILLECITFSVGMPYIVCSVATTGELTIIEKTYEQNLSAVMQSIQSKEC